jgi:hypothetical protein
MKLTNAALMCCTGVLALGLLSDHSRLQTVLAQEVPNSTGCALTSINGGYGLLLNRNLEYRVGYHRR